MIVDFNLYIILYYIMICIYSHAIFIGVFVKVL